MASWENDPCQRWRPDRTHTWVRRSDGGFDKSRYGVDAICEPDAEAYVTARHYSGSFVAAKLCYGLFDLQAEVGPTLSGVAVLSIPGGGKKMLEDAFPRLVPYHESLELGRLVLDEDVAANGESHFVSEAFRLAAVNGVRGIVSCSDPVRRRDKDAAVVMPGHVGIVYQSLNALLIGTTVDRTHWLMPDGTVFSPVAMQKIRSQSRGHEYAEKLLCRYGAPPMVTGQKPAEWLALALRAVALGTFRHQGCFKYAFGIGSPTQKRKLLIGGERLPYPKFEAVTEAEVKKPRAIKGLVLAA